MRLTPDLSALTWLNDFVPDAENFEWDKGNIDKNLKHGLSSEEIESIFWQEKYIFAGKIVEPTHDEWRGLILGQTENGKHVALIFTKRGEKLRPISCRPMRLNERRIYEENE